MTSTTSSQHAASGAIQVLPENATGKLASGFDLFKRWLVKPPAPKTVPRVIVATATLREMERAMQGEPHALATLLLFDESSPALADAWAGNDVRGIEKLLKAGDALTRDASHKAAEQFNVAVGYVDTARGGLRYLVEQSETALAPFNIDLAGIAPDKSKSMVSFVPVAALKRRLHEKLQFNAIGGQMIANALSGTVPWYVAVAVTGTALILDEINKRKRLRKLKELEGKLVVAAGVARGNIETTRTLLLTRVIPQYAALLDVITRLETGLADLVSPCDGADTTQREHAFALACTLIEGKHYLQMMGGN